jgi:phosphatidylglycerophosphate synthase
LKEKLMDPMMTLRTSAAVMTVVAAALVAANWNARLTVAFIIFIVASLASMIDGWLDSKASLVIQNGVFLLNNVLGVWRWLPKVANDMH